MRKMMTKEVTTTTIKLAQLTMVEGQPQAVTLPDEVVLGNVSLEKAQQLVNKKIGQGVTVFSIEADTKTYEMSVEDFIKVASLKVEEPETQE
jgi:hypothetical protein